MKDEKSDKSGKGKKRNRKSILKKQHRLMKDFKRIDYSEFNEWSKYLN